jgi:hypothetical protein
MVSWVTLFSSVCVLLPVATSGEGFLQQRSAVTNSDDGSTSGSQPTCSCDCCDVAIRRPGELSFGAGVKCTSSDSHNTDLCGDQCSPPKHDKVFKDEVVDSERYCFFECKPAAGGNAPESSQCIALTEKEAEKVVDPDGNPIDPAFLYSPAIQRPPASFFRGDAGASANLLSTNASLAKAYPGNPDEVDKKAAKKTALKGRAAATKLAADARKSAASLRKLEHSKQEELNKALKLSGDGTVVLDSMASIEDLHNAMLAAKGAAAEASISAAKAVDAYDMGRQKIWKISLSEAGKEVMRWKKFAEDKAAKELKARFAPTWASKVAKKAQKAAQPYIEAMLRAQESVKMFNTKGFDTAQKARALWAASQNAAAAANKMPRKTMRETNAAKSAMYDARETGKQAQDMGKEAQQYFKTAGEVRKTIPQFQYSAQKAANAAAVAMGAAR